MTANQNAATSERAHGSQPLLYQNGPLIQEYGTLRLLPIALGQRIDQLQLLAGVLVQQQMQLLERRAAHLPMVLLVQAVENQAVGQDVVQQLAAL